ncbi:hypothetical protein GA0115243_104772 [Streptomyces sp. ScaeMP-e83]|nr:hypothetical protein GA0115243_104772 [Streptomyces sp. ScaeMP-e83]
MRLQITVTDTGESYDYDVGNEQENEASERFLGNCLATLEVSRHGADGYIGPRVELRWIP